MRNPILLFALLIFCSMNIKADDFLKERSSGWFSLGTRNTFSVFNDIENETSGKGIGGQFRIQLNDRLNTEWFADYLTSQIGDYADRKDYHIGWSVMYYPGKNIYFEKILQPYILLGHCFDYTEVSIAGQPENMDHRWSIATQAGLGTHLNLTERLDISLSGQYMLHFGKELNVVESEGVYAVEKEDHMHIGGHLLISLSANFKFGRLWNN